MIQIPTLVLIALVYIFGIIIGTNIPAASPVLISLLLTFFLLLSISVFLKKYSNLPTKDWQAGIRIFNLYASLLLLSILYANNYFSITSSNLEGSENKPLKLTGIVISEPDVQKWQTNLIVKPEKIKLVDGSEFQPRKGKVLIRVRSPKKDILYGEKYEFSGVLRIPDEGKFKRYLQRHRIAATINVYDREKIQYVDGQDGNPLIKSALRIKKELIIALKNYISPTSFPLLGGTMLKAEIIPVQIRDMFTKIGIAHILAISGLHVGIMSGIFLGIFRLFNIPRRISYSITFILVILYALITGLGAPVVRASLMINLFLLGYIIRRKTNIFITLALASLIILLWNPYYLFGVGFQLSFITVLFIIVTPKLEKILKLKPILPASPVRNSFLIGVRIFFISIAAWLGSLPLVAYYFGYISWIGPLSNLIVIPLVTLILTFGFILLISIWVLPFLSYFLGAVVNFLLFLLLKTAEIVSSWSFVYSELSTFDLSMAFVYYLVVFLLLFYPEIKKFISPTRENCSKGFADAS